MPHVQNNLFLNTLSHFSVMMNFDESWGKLKTKWEIIKIVKNLKMGDFKLQMKKIAQNPKFCNFIR